MREQNSYKTNRPTEKDIESRNGPIRLWTLGASQRYNSNELGKNNISNNGTRSMGIHTGKMDPNLYKTYCNKINFRGSTLTYIYNVD